MKSEVVVVIGAGGIGKAIARRQGFGKHILLADYNEELLKAAASELETASYKVSHRKVDVSSRESVRELADAAAELGKLVYCRLRLNQFTYEPHRGSRETFINWIGVPYAKTQTWKKQP